jgi:hypothetical protein
MCAQGQVLHRNGYSEEDLFKMSCHKADKETARILGISVAHSIFLRRINDSEEGSPQEVLSNPEKYLGPNWVKVLDFWVYLDTLTEEQLKAVAHRGNALGYDGWSFAGDKVRGVVKASTKYFSYSGVAAYICIYNRFYYAREEAEFATLELIGGVENPVFVPLFYNHENI